MILFIEFVSGLFYMRVMARQEPAPTKLKERLS